MSNRPRILVLSFSPIAKDARVLKQVRLFAEQYAVTTCGYGESPDGVGEHIRIPDEYVYWQKDRSLLLQRRFAAVYRRNAVMDYLWDRLPRGSFDVVLADDVDTVPLALRLAPHGGVHADLHEYAPREKEDLARWRVFVGPYMAWLCREYVTQCASVTTVGQGIADEYQRVFGIPAGVVTNAAPYVDLEPIPVGNPIRMVHSGNAMRARGLVELVDAVVRARADVTLDLYLMPTEHDLLDELAVRSAGSGRVTIHDPVPYAHLVGTLNRYDVGVHVLPPVNFNNKWALPNKVFDYVQARLGLLVGPSPEMARMVREHDLGVVTEDFTTEATIAAIEALTPERVAAMKQAAHASAYELSAETQVQGWERAIDALMEKARHSRAR
ncbi:glycosyltransferase family 4 protein [Georgenia yuyongxinii]|uniref:Glycosyltransferase family 4 protein n=1 Tax=Georgenia yuyongxinii TaxID=2589797 RepID=A0A552WY26_9MICO|nr:glycosyltransferase family 4 protein [Georgenia yuyongxinii]TRW47585.1 glycosyltransferase family 4 protein [Georgenia yuyongxinii]